MIYDGLAILTFFACVTASVAGLRWASDRPFLPRRSNGGKL